LISRSVEISIGSHSDAHWCLMRQGGGVFLLGRKFSGLMVHMPTLQQMKLCFTRAVDPVKQKAITRLCHRSVLQ